MNGMTWCIFCLSSVVTENSLLWLCNFTFFSKIRQRWTWKSKSIIDIFDISSSLEVKTYLFKNVHRKSYHQSPAEIAAVWLCMWIMSIVESMSQSMHRLPFAENVGISVSLRHWLKSWFMTNTNSLLFPSNQFVCFVCERVAVSYAFYH